MIPISISKAVYSSAAVQLRRQMDKQRMLLGCSRRDGLPKFSISGKGKDFTRNSFVAVELANFFNKRRKV